MLEFEGGRWSIPAIRPELPALNVSIEQQLGLKFVDARAPFDVVIVDHVAKEPTEKLRCVYSCLLVLPVFACGAEFRSCVGKAIGGHRACAGPEGGPACPIRPVLPIRELNGRLTFRAFPGLRLDAQYLGPEWDSRRRRFLRCTPFTMANDTTKEQAALMMQNLLAERFHFKFHRETREFQSFRSDDREKRIEVQGIEAEHRYPRNRLPSALLHHDRGFRCE